MKPRKQKEHVEVVHEDQDLIIILKPAGLLSYPLKERRDWSAIQQIRRYWKARGFRNQHLYLLHRLDQETSGLMVFAKTTRARRSLTAQFRDHTVVRSYLAVTDGVPGKPSGKIVSSLGRDIRGKRAVLSAGKLAITRYEVVRSFEGNRRALVRCMLQTGRTHQVRIHLAHLGTPVVGDRVYGRKTGERLMLHAEALGFIHPRTGKPVVFRTSLPD